MLFSPASVFPAGPLGDLRFFLGGDKLQLLAAADFADMAMGTPAMCGGIALTVPCKRAR
jgi:hypothetical protein